MSTSDRSSTLRGTVTSGVLATLLAVVLAPSDPALPDLPVHPAWLIAAIAAAMVGARGLVAVPGVVGGVLVAELITGHTELAMLTRLTTPGELVALVAITLLACVGTMHHTRKARLVEQLADAEARATVAEAAVGQLSEVSIALRDRCDRSQTSLVFLSDLAVRMEDPDPTSAGDAALALAIARTGARGGFVQLLDHGRLKTLCSRGIWSADRLAPPSVFRDAVAVAALDRMLPVAAHEVDRATAEDSDLAAPLVDEHGTAIGVLALRGISYPALTAAAREDLAAVARWAGRSFARPRPRPSSHTLPAGEVRAGT